MTQNNNIVRYGPASLIIGGMIVIAAGAILEMTGIHVPSMLWSSTSFGVMARIGGTFMIVGLSIATWKVLRNDDCPGASRPLHEPGKQPDDAILAPLVPRRVKRMG